MSGCILRNKSHFPKKSIGWIWEMHRSLGSRKTYFYRDKIRYRNEKKQNLHDKGNRIVLCLIDLSLFSIAMCCSTTKIHYYLIIQNLSKLHQFLSAFYETSFKVRCKLLLSILGSSKAFFAIKWLKVMTLEQLLNFLHISSPSFKYVGDCYTNQMSIPNPVRITVSVLSKFLRGIFLLFILSGLHSSRDQTVFLVLLQLVLVSHDQIKYQHSHFQFDIGSCGLMSPGSTATVHIDYRCLDIKTTLLFN